MRNQQARNFKCQALMSYRALSFTEKCVILATRLHDQIPDHYVSKRKATEDYPRGKIKVFCSCHLLGKGKMAKMVCQMPGVVPGCQKIGKGIFSKKEQFTCSHCVTVADFLFYINRLYKLSHIV